MAAERVREDVREESSDHTVAVGRPGAEGDESEHVQAAVDEGCPATLEERPSPPEHHWRGKCQLQPGKEAGGERMLQRLAWQHLRHGQQEDRGS